MDRLGSKPSMGNSSTSGIAIGVDIGGTNLKAGLVDQEGEVLSRLEQAVPVEKTPALVVKTIVEMVQKLIDDPGLSKNLLGVGLGVPGGIDVGKGLVTESPHFPRWKNVSLKSELTKFLNQKIILDNDSNCFALGELHFGLGKNCENFLALTLGTGLGGALVINKSLWHGTSGMAGEFGHMGIDPEGPDCPCGGKGCLETFSSGSALIRLAEKEMKKQLTGEILEKEAENGNQKAKEIFSKFGSTLGYGLANLVNIMGITNIIIGGKVTRSWEYFYPAILKAISNQCFQKVAEKVNIRPSSLEDNAGIVGAASLVLYN